MFASIVCRGEICVPILRDKETKEPPCLAASVSVSGGGTGQGLGTPSSMGQDWDRALIGEDTAGAVGASQHLDHCREQGL